MTKRDLCRIVSGILVVLIGIAVGFGGFQLWAGVPSSRPDLVADASTIKGAAVGMLVLAAFLLLAGSAAIASLRWGRVASAIALLVFVAGGFWVNYAVFGGVRLMHSGANVVVAAVALLLLWLGARREA